MMPNGWPLRYAHPPGLMHRRAALACALHLTIGPSNATTNIAAACGAAVWMISTPGALRV